MGSQYILKKANLNVEFTNWPEYDTLMHLLN